jgi:predicted nucleotide-binding protein
VFAGQERACRPASASCTFSDVPSIRIPVSRVTLRSDFPEALCAVLRPAALAAARANVAALREQTPGPLSEKYIGSAQAQVDRGGDLSWRYWSITSKDGIEYGSVPLSNDEPDHELFDEALHVTGMVHIEPSLATPSHAISFMIGGGNGEVTITAPDDEVRDAAAQLRTVLDGYTSPDTPAPSLPFKVFIAYGGGRMWEVVRDYLRAADIAVDAFTESERASQQTIHVVSDMIRSASFAVIVLTAADQVGDAWQARQNVIHELGFAQGALGLQRTVLLKEKGVHLPSNLDGTNYIEFARGEIHTTRERVVNIIRSARADQSGGIR